MAKPNVIFELGYFFAALGRKHVCILYEDGVKIPSDCQGIVYKDLANDVEWQNSLTAELRPAGFASR